MSKVSVCNRALVMVGSPPITSFQDGTTEAIACSAIYPEVVKEILEEHFWSFARERLVIPKDINSSEFGGFSRFQIPSRTVHIAWVVDQPDLNPDYENNPLDWRVEGTNILAATNSERVYAMSINGSVSESSFSPGFNTCLSYRMAAELALTLSDSASKYQMMMDRYYYHKKKAVSVDSVQGKSVRIKSTNILTGRR
jgi:hypothetical protein